MRKSNTEKLSDILRGYVKENKLDKKLAEVDVISSWEEVMGKTVASYTENLWIQHETLFVKVSSPILRNELLLMKEDIRKRLNEKAGSELIKQVLFR